MLFWFGWEERISNIHEFVLNFNMKGRDIINDNEMSVLGLLMDRFLYAFRWIFDSDELAY